MVADEERKLAERTGNSTSQIAGTISKINEEIGLAVAVMESSVSEVGSSVALTERADDAIGRIRRDATMTAQAVGNISHALQGQSALASDVGTRIESIARMAEATQRSAQHSAAISQRLRRLADSLQQRLGHFSLT